MTLVDAETAARPNGTAGPPAVALPPPDEAPTGAPTEADAAPAAPAISGAADAVHGRHLVIAFDRVTRRVLDPDAYVALRAEARRLVEGTTLSQYEIARRLDIKTTTLSYWKRREGWTRPPGAPPPLLLATALPPGEKTEVRRLRMIGRLYRVFERQTADLEARAVRPGATTDEKDARTLSVLAKTLETLIALDRDDGAKTEAAEPADRDRLNADLARRIRQWAESRE